MHNDTSGTYVDTVDCRGCSLKSLNYMYTSPHVITGSGVYYGWSVGAVVLALLLAMVGMAHKKMACSLYTSKQLVIGLFAVTCAVTWLLWYYFQACCTNTHAIQPNKQTCKFAGFNVLTAK